MMSNESSHNIIKINRSFHGIQRQTPKPSANKSKLEVITKGRDSLARDILMADYPLFY